MLQSEEDEELPDANTKSTCSGRRCSANEHCCSGTVCVDLDGRKFLFCIYISYRPTYDLDLTYKNNFKINITSRKTERSESIDQCLNISC